MKSYTRFFTRYARIAVIVLAVLVGSMGFVAYAPVTSSQVRSTVTPAVELYAQPSPIPTAIAQAGQTAETTANLDTEPFIRTELFFGSERPNKPEVSKQEFNQFLDQEVTPRFPDGLTLVTGTGQFREGNGEIVQETSFVLILLYPGETAKDSSAKIEEIRNRYIERFQQESVLRVDDPRPVRVSF